MIDNAHVLWAYDNILREYEREGLTPSEMRYRLREEWSLHVGIQAIKDVLGIRPKKKPNPEAT